uniref:RNA polymerase subunit alpha n=1 Tax=Leontynka pallida TaxID=2912034 RepID=UPI002028C5A3|nr:RNA polymerase subunit alpha [Leontynka pallida]UPQ43837.1 RNA polymerase subunit alpha [Leontynka pallida]
MDFLSNFYISCKESKIENNKSFYGCFHLGPFEPSQSITIANALRRTLLSELKGLAITGVEIDGALHEYSNLVGVKDSVLDILLNLKEVVLRKATNFNTTSHFWRTSTRGFTWYNDTSFRSSNVANSPFIGGLNCFGYLKVRGPGVVRASDLRLPPNIQCVDPDQYIATLTEDGFLSMKLVIEEGDKYTDTSNSSRWHNSAEPHLLTPNRMKSTLIQNINKLLPNSIANKTAKEQKKIALYNTRNLLRIDALFNPITKVNYQVELLESEATNSNFDSLSQLENTLEVLNWDHLHSKHVIDKSLALANSCSTLSTSLGITDMTGDSLEQLEKKVTKVTTKPVSHFNDLQQKHNILLEIWTNGSIHPRQALQTALNNLVNVFIKLQKTQVYTNFVLNYNNNTGLHTQSIYQTKAKVSRKQTLAQNRVSTGAMQSTAIPAEQSAAIPAEQSAVIPVNNTYALSRNTKDLLFQKWLSKYISQNNSRLQA